MLLWVAPLETLEAQLLFLPMAGWVKLLLSSGCSAGGQYPGEHVCLSVSMDTTLVQATLYLGLLHRLLNCFLCTYWPCFFLSIFHSINETMPLKMSQLHSCHKLPSPLLMSSSLSQAHGTCSSLWPESHHMFGSVSFFRFAQMSPLRINPPWLLSLACLTLPCPRCYL